MIGRASSIYTLTGFSPRDARDEYGPNRNEACYVSRGAFRIHRGGGTLRRRHTCVATIRPNRSERRIQNRRSNRDELLGAHTPAVSVPKHLWRPSLLPRVGCVYHRKADPGSLCHPDFDHIRGRSHDRKFRCEESHILPAASEPTRRMR